MSYVRIIHDHAEHRRKSAEDDVQRMHFSGHSTGEALQNRKGAAHEAIQAKAAILKLLNEATADARIDRLAVILRYQRYRSAREDHRKALAGAGRGSATEIFTNGAQNEAWNALQSLKGRLNDHDVRQAA